MAKKTEKTNKTRDFLDGIMKKLKADVKSDDHNRKEAIEDLKFSWGIDQWDPKEAANRRDKKRPVMQANLLPQYIDRVTGDQRMNRARISIVPEDSKADYNIAKIRQGIVSDIEYRSNAESIYDAAGEMQTTCGYGAWRVLTRFTKENPFLQEIYYEPINNPFLVYMDCNSKDSVYADAKHGFIIEKIPKTEFEERYPDAVVPGTELNTGQGLDFEHWYDKDTVTVAEYFAIIEEEKTMCLMDDGTVLEKSEAEAMIQEASEHNEKLQAAAQQAMALQAQAMQAQQQQSNPHAPLQQPQAPLQQPQAPPKPFLPPQMFQLEPIPAIAKERVLKMPKVKHWVVTASEILEPQKSKGEKTQLAGDDFPGKYIPINFVTGKTINIEGKKYIRGLIRFAKDPQKLFNYSLTSATEIVHIMPKAPWTGTAKQFQGYEQDYASANIENLPFLKYNMDVVNGVPAPPPQRTSMGDVPVAMFAEIDRAEGLVRKAIGMGERAVGGGGQERSGVAVIAAQKPGDITTFAFQDNLAKAIAHCGVMTNEMIPEVYDTKRDARIRDVDGLERWVPINTNAGEALELIMKNPERYQGLDPKELKKLIGSYGKKAKYNDINEGRYGVKVTVGPSVMTQRQESAQALLSLSQNWPEIKRFAGDILLRNFDFLGADEASDRLERTLPPGMKRFKPGDVPKPPMPPAPQAVLLQAKAQTEQIKAQKEKIKAEVEMIKMKTELVKQLKETKETDQNIRKEIIKVLEQLNSIQQQQINIPGQEPDGT
jgi:hypothetical protein